MYQLCTNHEVRFRESLLDTGLKFQDFSVTLILREINLKESRNGKIVILAILGALNCVDLVNFSLQKVEKKHENQNSDLLNEIEWHILIL